jgi:D-arginine dehydrogenase
VADSQLAVDAVVVGGGIAGVSAAHFLAQAGAEVLVLEQEPVLAHHTTGRSAALYMENYGSVPVRRLALASRAFLEAPPPGLAEAPLLSPRPALEVGGRGRAGALEAQAARGASLVSGIRLLSPAEAVAQCPVLRVQELSGGVLDPGSMDIDVMALHQAFVRGLRRAGGAVRASAAVVALDRVGGAWRVRTPDAEVVAPIVVNAAGAWADVIAALAGVGPIGLRPLRRTAFTVPVPAGLASRAWPLVHDLDEGWYFKPEGDGLLCSLADEAPDEPRDPRPRDEDVALAMERINTATTLGLRSVRTAWAGLRTFAPDRTPVVGCDPRAPGFVWVAGLGGVGIMTSPAVGMLAAASALGQPLPEALVARAVDAADYSVQRLR